MANADRSAEQFRKMTETPIPKLILSLAAPTILSMLITSIYNLADTFFVGQISTSASGAVGIVSSLMAIIQALGFMFGHGAGGIISRSLGNQDTHAATKFASTSFFTAMAVGAVLAVGGLATLPRFMMLLGSTDTILPHASAYARPILFAAPLMMSSLVMNNILRYEGKASFAMIGLVTGGVLNIVLDPIFILPWGLNLGAAVAGCATCLSNTVACLYFFVLLFVKRGKTYVCIKPSMFRPSKQIVKGVCGVGIPASIQNLLNVTGMTILNNFTSAYGSDPVAAMGIAQRVNMVPFQIAMGFSQGIMPLIGYTYASGNAKRMKKAVVFTTKISLGFLVMITVLYYLFAGSLISLFMDNKNIVAYGTALLRGLCLSLIFLCMDFLAVGIFQACGMGTKAFVFALLRKIVLEIPALYVLNRIFPLYGLAYAQLLAEVILSIAAVAVLIHLFKNLSSKVK